MTPSSSLSARADQARIEVSTSLETERRSELGQFMTPQAIAVQMAKMFGQLPPEIRLLDAGAGVGSLTAAFVTHALKLKKRPKSISVTAFEIDASLAERLRSTLKDCEQECAERGVSFKANLIEDDYILRSSEPLLRPSLSYNCAILNPPYAKINSTSRWRFALRSLGIETVNLYSAFVAIALDQLEADGQLVAITPRSFCNGSYYEPFRKHLLSKAELLRLHVFESRKTAFKEDSVLQENVIFQLRKGQRQPATVEIETDGGEQRSVPFGEVVRGNDAHCFIRLTISTEDAALAASVQALPCRLSDLGISVSTGRVVDFRAREHLRKEASHDTVPLIYPAHMREGGIRWPIPDFKKHNAIAANIETESLLIPAGRYVLTKRFSAKEERRRLVASLFNSTGAVGIENHLNYFHQSGAGLPLALGAGLTAFLNSTAVDDYFRQFSGHTQVNATDLRNLHYPTRAQLEKLGRRKLKTQSEIDGAITELLAMNDA